MSKTVTLVTKTENINLTGNNNTYTKNEIDEKIKTIQNAGGVGKIVYTGSFTSDGGCTIPVEIDYVTILYGSTNYTVSVGSSIMGPSIQSISYGGPYSTSFSLNKSDGATYRISNSVDSSKVRDFVTFNFTAYKYF